MGWGKKVLRGSAVLLVAFAAGHIAETLKASDVAGAPVLDEPQRAELLHSGAGSIDEAIPQSASLSAGARPGLTDVVGIVPVAATTDTPQDGCTPALQLVAAPEAMIELSLTAPCNRGERIVVRHSGLAFSARTNPEGKAELMVPALKVDALVAVYLEGSRLALGKVEVPDAANFTRLALIWDVGADFELRMTEGDHVLVGTNAATDATARKIIPLGLVSVQNPVLARVYSTPGASLGDAQITAELQITPVTCGRTLQVETLLSLNGKVTQSERSVAVPLCGTSGDILVLKNLPPDPTLAIRG
jgi:hypothetical protein